MTNQNDAAHASAQAVRDYAEAQAMSLLRGPQDQLRHPFISPGAGYTHDLWDWDSHFTSIALLDLLTPGSEARAATIAATVGSLLNFLDAQQADGYIPPVIVAGENSHSLLLRRGGFDANPAKPVLAACALLAHLVTDGSAEASPIREAWPRLWLFHLWCRAHMLDDRSQLFVWINDVMIGADNDPSTFGRPPRSSANLLLNALMVRDYRCLERLAEILGRDDELQLVRKWRRELEIALVGHCWDARDAFFYSVDTLSARQLDPIDPARYHTGLGVLWPVFPQRIRTWTAVLPVWLGLADSTQAEAVLSAFRDEARLAGPFGPRTMSADEPFYNVSESSNPSNWLGGVWGIAVYFAVGAARRVGDDELADDLARRYQRTLAADIEATGAMHEYYDPDSGKGRGHHGFLSWNLLASTLLDEPRCSIGLSLGMSV